MQQLYKVYEKETPYRLVAADLQGDYTTMRWRITKAQGVSWVMKA